jgi:hypothetical protein
MDSLFHIEVELKNLLESLETEPDSKEEKVLGKETSLRLINLTDALIQKTDQVAIFRESLEIFVELLNTKMKELKDRKDLYERKIEKFDDYVSSCLSIQDKTEFSGQLYKIKKRKPALSVSIIDESKIPIEFIKIPEVKPTIMKAEIAKLLKQGEVIEGAELVEGKVSIQYSLK